jgi:hypothetical protein
MLKVKKGAKYMKFIQINLHHGSSVPPTCCENADAAIIHEPWIYGCQIKGSVSSEETSFLLHPREMQGPVFMSGLTLMFHLCWSSVTGIQQW